MLNENSYPLLQGSAWFLLPNSQHLFSIGALCQQLRYLALIIKKLLYFAAIFTRNRNSENDKEARGFVWKRSKVKKKMLDRILEVKKK